MRVWRNVVLTEGFSCIAADAAKQAPAKPKAAAQPKAAKPAPKAVAQPAAATSGLATDMAALGLQDEVKIDTTPVAAVTMKRQELLDKVRQDEGKDAVSLVVIGHVDAGKSTLMGRLLYDLGELSEKEKVANERGSQKVGKSSFAFAWGLDALGDERDRGVTIDIATSHFETPHRSFTLLDAPGHRDFIPNMISGATQADLALLVVDASPGEFESGFEGRGQTREHALLVRSLGVRELIVGINKMDMVEFSQDRFDEIEESMRPFLQSAGFAPDKTTFIPVAAMAGVNIGSSGIEWYKGPTLVDALDKVQVPPRPIEAPLRVPISNVFKGQTAVASGVAVSGRVASGILQVGERLRVVPGDATAAVRSESSFASILMPSELTPRPPAIETDTETAQYASAGQNVTLYLAGIDPIALNIGCVLCPLGDLVPLATTFVAQVLVFDIATPIIGGTPVELFHHSNNVPATISKLRAVLDKGTVSKRRPRVLQRGMQAEVEITLRANPNALRAPSIAIETASVNKDMSRVLLRRGGETIAAGVVMEIL